MALPGLVYPQRPIYRGGKHDWWGKSIASAFDVWGEHKARQEFEARQAVADARAARNEVRAAQRHGEIMSKYAREKAIYNDALAKQQEREGKASTNYTSDILLAKGRELHPAELEFTDTDLSGIGTGLSDEDFATPAYTTKASDIQIAEAQSRLAHSPDYIAKNLNNLMLVRNRALDELAKIQDAENTAINQGNKVEADKLAIKGAETQNQIKQINLLLKQQEQAVDQESANLQRQLTGYNADIGSQFYGAGTGFSDEDFIHQVEALDKASPQYRAVINRLQEINKIPSTQANDLIERSLELEAEGKGPPPLTKEQKQERYLNILFGQSGVPSEYQAREEFGENPDQNLYVADPTMRAYKDAYGGLVASGYKFSKHQEKAMEEAKKRVGLADVTVGKAVYSPSWPLTDQENYKRINRTIAEEIKLHVEEINAKHDKPVVTENEVSIAINAISDAAHTISQQTKQYVGDIMKRILDDPTYYLDTTTEGEDPTKNPLTWLNEKTTDVKPKKARNIVEAYGKKYGIEKIGYPHLTEKVPETRLAPPLGISDQQWRKIVADHREMAKEKGKPEASEEAIKAHWEYLTRQQDLYQWQKRGRSPATGYAR